MTKHSGSLENNPPQLEAVNAASLSEKFYRDPSLTQAYAALPTDRASGSVPAQIDMNSPYPEASEAGVSGSGAAKLPAPIQQALAEGKPIRFSSSGENQAASRQPDYFLTPEGKLEPNPNAQPNPDGSINVEIQAKKQEDNKSLKDAITHETDMQKQWAKEMIRLFQEQNPGQPVPAWMNDLASAKPNLPDFVPSSPTQNQPATPPPENGFANRGVRGGGGGGSGGGGSGGGGDAGFAGNGGFDSNGYFKGNGSAGDGALPTGGSDSRGQPLGPGETVQVKQLYDYLLDQSKAQGVPLSPAQVSGILGNLQTESSFKTNAFNAGEGAIGFAQWEGGRRTQLEQFAAQQNKPVTDWHVQADFLLHELKGSESGAYSRLAATGTPAEAAAAFDKYYERSSGAARGQRMANAENIAKVVNA